MEQGAGEQRNRKPEKGKWSDMGLTQIAGYKKIAVDIGEGLAIWLLAAGKKCFEQQL